eukprot:TRINITY_DN2277_c0_g1_i1.p2 TRINITY_DN2277_c0_g1~~TRINITY_DN2277_c0_g1_i1.p2  ORF type:complete len:288 (-),score=66.02 TRINITY_DN2277_c0_g1_i1:288-1151(-)
MAKVIKEAAEKVKDVMILPDGSWEPTPYREELEDPICSAESNLFERLNSVDSDQFVAPVIDLSLRGESRNSAIEDVGTRNGAGKVLDERDVKPDMAMDISSAGSVFVKDLLHLVPSIVPSTGLARLESHDEVSLPSSPRETGSRVADETDVSIYGSGSQLTYAVSGSEQQSGETSPAGISFQNESAEGRVGGISGAQNGNAFDTFPISEGIATLPGFGQGWSEAVHQQVWPTNSVEASMSLGELGGRARVTATYMPNDSGGRIHFAPNLQQELRDDNNPDSDLPMLV